MKTTKTVRDLLKAAYPRHMARIEELAKPGRLDEPPRWYNAGHYLGNAFAWHKTTEGLDYWSDLADAGCEPPLEIKAGDVVDLRVTVVEQPGTGKYFSYLQAGGALARACIANIVHVEPRPLKVGDTVRFNDVENDNDGKTIIAIDGDEAWVKWPSGRRLAYSLTYLERVP